MLLRFAAVGLLIKKKSRNREIDYTDLTLPRQSQPESEINDIYVVCWLTLLLSVRRKVKPIRFICKQKRTFLYLLILQNKIKNFTKLCFSNDHKPINNKIVFVVFKKEKCILKRTNSETIDLIIDSWREWPDVVCIFSI